MPTNIYALAIILMAVTSIVVITPGIVMAGMLYRAGHRTMREVIYTSDGIQWTTFDNRTDQRNWNDIASIRAPFDTCTFELSDGTIHRAGPLAMRERRLFGWLIAERNPISLEALRKAQWRSTIRFGGTAMLLLGITAIGFTSGYIPPPDGGVAHAVLGLAGASTFLFLVIGAVHVTFMRDLHRRYGTRRPSLTPAAARR
ncbi:MAG: hypothetical protein ACR2GY_14170 [Phycisphaerales bacterium]